MRVVCVAGCKGCPVLCDAVSDYISSTAPCCGLVKAKPGDLDPSLHTGLRGLPPDDEGLAPSVAPEWCPLRAHGVLLVLND